MNGFVGELLFGRSALRRALRKHFGSASVGDIATAAREFPITSRVDVQVALEQVFAQQANARLLGVHSQMGHETPTLAQLFTPGPFQMDVGPLQHDEVDVGDELPVRCLKNGLWLSRQGELPAAVLLGPSMQHGAIGGVHVEVAVPIGEPGAAFSKEFFRDLEVRVGAGKTYRGRVLSLESQYNDTGQGGAVKVHRLRQVAREDIILCRTTRRCSSRPNTSSSSASTSAWRVFCSRRSWSSKMLISLPGTGFASSIRDRNPC